MNFPEGIHYLGSESYIAGSHFTFNWLGLISAVIFILDCMFLYLAIKDRDKGLAINCLLGLICSAIITIIMFFSNPTYYTQYKVMIEDYVPFSVIQEEYDIAKVDENIVYLRPHEPIPWEE